MKIVCISGKAGSGKDTFAEELSKVLKNSGNRVLITHYADLLKYICTNFFGWNGEKDENGRNLIQYVGTDVVREINPDYWVNFIISILRLFPDMADYVLIPDARFENEVERLKEEEFDVLTVRIEREFKSNMTEQQLKHESETALDNYEFDVVVNNTEHIDFINNVLMVFDILNKK